MALQTKRNRLLHRIRERSKALARDFIDEKIAIMRWSNRSTHIFEATRDLFLRRLPPISLHDITDNFILSRQATGIKIKKHFQDLFFDPKHTPVADDGVKRLLSNPITAFEIERAFWHLQNGSAMVPNSMPAELLKLGLDL